MRRTLKLPSWAYVCVTVRPGAGPAVAEAPEVREHVGRVGVARRRAAHRDRRALRSGERTVHGGDRRLRAALDLDLDVVGQEREQVVAATVLRRRRRSSGTCASRRSRMPASLGMITAITSRSLALRDVREPLIARHDHGDFPRARGDHDLAFVLHRALVAGDAGDDVDLLVLEAARGRRGSFP